MKETASEGIQAVTAVVEGADQVITEALNGQPLNVSVPVDPISGAGDLGHLAHTVKVWLTNVMARLDIEVHLNADGTGRVHGADGKIGELRWSFGEPVTEAPETLTK